MRFSDDIVLLNGSEDDLLKMIEKLNIEFKIRYKNELERNQNNV